MATQPLPPRSVADIAVIKTNNYTDLMGMVRSVSDKRVSKGGHEIVDVEVMDKSVASCAIAR